MANEDIASIIKQQIQNYHNTIQMYSWMNVRFASKKMNN